MEQRRLLLAFALSLLLLWGYEQLVVSRYPRRQAPVSTAEKAAEAPKPSSTPSTPAPPSGPASDLSAPPTEAPPVTIETDVYRAAVTPLGARLLSLELKDFKREVKPDSPPLDLVQLGPVLPGTVRLGPGASDARVLYRPDRQELVVHGGEQGEVVFVGEGPDGTKLEKRYGFGGGSYVFDVSVAVGNPGLPRVGLVLTPVRPDHPAGRGNGGDVGIALADRRVQEKAATELAKHEVKVEAPQWAGFAAHYFLAVVIPQGNDASAIMTTADETPIVSLEEPSAEGRARFSVFAGPKAREVLVAVGHDLDRALDFGWFWFIAVPLLHALRLLHGVTGNFGVAIIVLTALVKLATTPLTQSTFRNMREMQKIQPQMTKLRERFKDDQVALQKEIMELYRRHRVNPFSGCLPMILQLPIFVGLYNALSHAIELRHAPFMLWINDLSAPDRLMVAGIGIPVLTLLMGATMFVQQWMSPQQGDPTQQRMMMIMPLMFTFMFMNFPAGLVLYWLVNNVLTIGQQYFIMRPSS